MLISFGELLVDLIKNQENAFDAFPGGSPANFSVGLARLGLRPKLIACVGRDFFGDMLIDNLKKENVDTSAIKRSGKKTTLVFVELNETIPEFVFYRSADVDICKEDINETFFCGAKWFHFVSLSLTEDRMREALFHCLKLAKTYGLTVSFSPNIRKDIWNKKIDKHIFKSLEYVDVLIASQSEYEHIFGKASFEAVSKMFNIGKIAVTKGKDGCSLYSNHRTNGTIIQHPAFAVETVDTTGAGDAFAAGFVYSLMKGKADDEAIRFASAVAALSTTKKGAMSGLPVLEDVEDFLTNQNNNII